MIREYRTMKLWLKCDIVNKMNDPDTQKISVQALNHLQEHIPKSRQDGKTEVKLWYDNGMLSMYQVYSNAKPDGECIFWYNDGQLSQAGFYKNGKSEGECKNWTQNGNIFDHKSYHLGLLDGLSRFWIFDGPILEQIFYRNGNREGEYRKYNRFGNVDRRFYMDNILIVSDFTPQIKKTFLQLKREFGVPAFFKKYKILDVFLIQDLLMLSMNPFK